MRKDLLRSIAVIIPARNEAGTIARVIGSIREELPDADVIVVDDHSEDATAREASRCERVTVLRSPISLGVGGAVQLGIRYGLSRGYGVFVRMDGDGQHPAAFLREMLRHAGPGCLVQGSREPARFAASSSFLRRLGSRYFRFLFRCFAGSRVTDPTSGFMCFGRDLAEKFAEFYPLDYPEIETLALLARSGYRIIPVTVEMHSRSAGESSLGPARGAVFMAAMTLAFFAAFIRRNPYGAAHAR
jgi:glycosyltransferase involved in cell wall biosynthesis